MNIPLATIQRTTDFTDCIKRGWEYTLYSDGHVLAEAYVSAKKTGLRYVTESGFVQKYFGKLTDPVKTLETLAEDTDPARDEGWFLLEA